MSSPELAVHCRGSDELVELTTLRYVFWFPCIGPPLIDIVISGRPEEEIEGLGPQVCVCVVCVWVGVW